MVFRAPSCTPGKNYQQGMPLAQQFALSLRSVWSLQLPTLQGMHAAKIQVSPALVTTSSEGEGCLLASAILFAPISCSLPLCLCLTCETTSIALHLTASISCTALALHPSHVSALCQSCSLLCSSLAIPLSLYKQPPPAGRSIILPISNTSLHTHIPRGLAAPFRRLVGAHSDQYRPASSLCALKCNYGW